MQKTFISIAILLVLTTSCKKQQTSVSHDTVSIELGKNPSFISADSVFSDVEYVVLETTDESIFYDINKIELYNDRFYLLDGKQDAILVFDRNGKFEKKLLRKGQGPGEYVSLDDFFIKDGFLYGLASANRKIFVYDDNFNNIMSLPMGIFSTNIEYLHDNIFIYSNFASSECKNIYVLDVNTGAEKNKFADFLKKQLGVRYSTSGFAKMQDSLFMAFPYDYSIYHISPNSYAKYLDLDFGKKNMFPTKWIKYSDDERTDKIKSMYSDFWDLPIGRINNLYLSENVLFFTFVYRMLEHKFFLNRQTGKSLYGYISETEQFPLSNGHLLGIINDKIIMSSNADNILDQMEYMKTHKFKINFKFDLQPEDNPVLSIYSLKNWQ